MMKRMTIALAAVGVACLPLGASAASAQFGGDYSWSGFRTDTSSLKDTASDKYQAVKFKTGYNQLLRLKGALKNDDGVSLNFRLKLSDTNWEGDTHATNGMAGPYTNQASDLVSLDYGYVQFPLAGWTIRVGRQEANWGFNFLTSDDRRDRILALRKFGGVTVLGAMDKRQEGSLTNDKDDGDLVAAGAIGVTNGWLWGILPGYFYGTKKTDGGGFAFSDIALISGFAKGKVGPVELMGTVNIVGGAPDGQGYFETTAESEFVRVGWSTGPVKLEGQLVGVQHGGLIAGGFDTFSTLINNNPDNMQSNTNVANIGSAAVTDVTDKLTQWLPAVRVTGKVGDKVTLMGAAGDFISKNDSKFSKAEFSRYFLDLQAHYHVTPSLETYATLGWLSGDDSAKDNAGTKTKLSDQAAWTVNLSANF